MRKAFFHFTILLCVFGGVWLSISRIDFVTGLNIRQVTKENERKIGDFILKTIRTGAQELDSDPARALAATIKERICKANGVSGASIELHIMIDDDVNAFALPGRHLIINSGLLRYCKNPEELSGVIAHEIAHIEHHDVMKKLAGEVGLSMLTAMAGGTSSGEIGRQTIKLLSSTAFDREQERKADSAAVQMMAKANIDPEHLANLLFRLSQEKKSLTGKLEWLNTHPNAPDRAADILKLRKKEIYKPSPVVTPEEWKSLQAQIERLKIGGDVRFPAQRTVNFFRQSGAGFRLAMNYK
jgi:beta-barrel assembly-enhancing protease